MAYNLGQFKTFLEESYRPGTVYEYLWRVRKFLDWLGGAPIKSVDQNTIVEYIRYLRQNGVRQTSTYAYALKCYFEFIGRNDLSGKVPVRRENVGKVPIWLPEPALKVLIAHIGDERMKVLATVMYDLALRVSEALMLNVGPLDSNIPWVDVSGTFWLTFTGLKQNLIRLTFSRCPVGRARLLKDILLKTVSDTVCLFSLQNLTCLG